MRPEEKKVEEGVQFDKNDYKSPRKGRNSKKRKIADGLDNKYHAVKIRKEFEWWEGLDDLMRARIPWGNCRTRGEGPSDLFADVWQEIWEDDVKKAHKKNLYGK